MTLSSEQELKHIFHKSSPREFLCIPGKQKQPIRQNIFDIFNTKVKHSTLECELMYFVKTTEEFHLYLIPEFVSASLSNRLRKLRQSYYNKPDTDSPNEFESAPDSWTQVPAFPYVKNLLIQILNPQEHQNIRQHKHPF